jgi:hypothetical protein
LGKDFKAHITMTTNHELNPGDRIKISGSHNGALDGEGTICAVTNNTTFYLGPWYKRWLFYIVRFVYKIWCKVDKIFRRRNNDNEP